MSSYPFRVSLLFPHLDGSDESLWSLHSESFLPVNTFRYKAQFGTFRGSWHNELEHKIKNPITWSIELKLSGHSFKVVLFLQPPSHFVTILPVGLCPKIDCYSTLYEHHSKHNGRKPSQKQQALSSNVVTASLK